MLHPEGLPQLAWEVQQAHPEASGNPLSKGVHGDGILQKMASQYDATQYNAIVVSPSSAHLMPFRIIQASF